MHVWTGAHGLRLVGDSWGPPEGPLVILQHGGGQTRHAWKRAGEQLAAAGYRAACTTPAGMAIPIGQLTGATIRMRWWRTSFAWYSSLGDQAAGRIRQARLEACARARVADAPRARGVSDVLTGEGAREFIALCAHCEYVNVPNAAHMVAGDRNDVFVSAVLDFLSRTVPVDRAPANPPHELHPHREGPAGEVEDIR